MTTELARQTGDATGLTVADQEQASAAILHYLGTGDLSKLTGDQRAALYRRTCDSLGINSLTRPFDWIEFYDPETKGKKLTLYPRSACADQLAYQHRIRVRVVEEKIVGSLFKVVVEGTMPNGRSETNVAYLELTDRDGAQLKGQRLGNAFMKAHTKAKRRLVFGMVGMMAPPDVEELQQARVVYLDGRGNVLDAPSEEQKVLAEHPKMARAIGEPIFEDVPLDAAPIADGPDQRPRPEDLEHPTREGPRPSFRASDEDIRRWCGAWFGIVDETPWDTKDARAQVVLQWTAGDAGWPEGKVTDSLRTMFARCTSDEAADFLAKIRAVVDVWKQGQAAEEAGDDELGADVGMTPVQAAEEVVRQRGYAVEPVGDLSDEELDARLGASSERRRGGEASPQGPKTELIIELRRVVEECKAAGGNVEMPEGDLLDLDADVIAGMIRDLRAGLEGLKAVG